MIDAFKLLHDNLDRLSQSLRGLQSKNAPFDRIYYINLDKRTDRREHIENEIKKVLDSDLKITRRMPGVVCDGYEGRVKGAIGCSMSHQSVIAESIRDGLNNVMIFEDDFEFLCDRNRFMQDLERFMKTHPDYDILLFGVNSPAGIYRAPSRNNAFIKVNASQTTSGYMVSKKGLPKMKAACDRSVEGLKTTKCVQAHAVDLEWHSVMKEGNVYAFPYRVGRQMQSYSDIELRMVNYKI